MKVHAFDGGTSSIEMPAQKCTGAILIGAYFEHSETSSNWTLYIHGNEDAITPDDVYDSLPKELYVLVENIPCSYTDEDKLKFKTLYLLHLIISRCDESSGTADDIFNHLTDFYYDEEWEREELYTSIKTYHKHLVSKETPCAYYRSFGMYSFNQEATSLLSKLKLNKFKNDETRTSIVGCLLVELLSPIFKKIKIEWIPKDKEFDIEGGLEEGWDGFEKVTIY